MPFSNRKVLASLFGLPIILKDIFVPFFSSDFFFMRHFLTNNRSLFIFHKPHSYFYLQKAELNHLEVINKLISITRIITISSPHFLDYLVSLVSMKLSEKLITQTKYTI